MGADGAIILDILNLIGRFFKFGMETKQFPSLISNQVPRAKINLGGVYQDLALLFVANRHDCFTEPTGTELHFKCQ